MKFIIFNANHYSTLNIGDKVIPCAVLENGVRVIQASGLFSAFEATQHGRRIDDNLPSIIGGNNLREFITPEVMDLCIPYKYVHAGNDSVKDGYDAKLLPHVCMIYKTAGKAGRLTKQQEKRVRMSEILLDSLAVVGITGLIDEVTGFEKDKKAGDLANTFTTYVAKCVMEYGRCFSDEFFIELYRLYHWKLDPFNPKKPHAVGIFINKYIYGYFPDEVQKFLKEKSKVISKNENMYKNHYYKYLSKTIGKPELDAQIKAVLTIMKLSEDIDDFRSKYERAMVTI